MNRLQFLSTLIIALCAALAGLFTRKEEFSLRFFWVDEDSEVFVAKDIESLNAYLGRHGRREEGFELMDELLTEENEGVVWGCASADDIVMDEDGTERTFQQAVEDWYQGQPWFQKRPVAQIATCYS